MLHDLIARYSDPITAITEMACGIALIASGSLSRLEDDTDEEDAILARYETAREELTRQLDRADSMIDRTTQSQMNINHNLLVTVHQLACGLGTIVRDYDPRQFNAAKKVRALLAPPDELDVPLIFPVVNDDTDDDDPAPVYDPDTEELTVPAFLSEIIRTIADSDTLPINKSDYDILVEIVLSSSEYESTPHHAVTNGWYTLCQLGLGRDTIIFPAEEDDAHVTI